jgi:hypothetical protein
MMITLCSLSVYLSSVLTAAGTTTPRSCLTFTSTRTNSHLSRPWSTSTPTQTASADVIVSMLVLQPRQLPMADTRSQSLRGWQGVLVGARHMVGRQIRVVEVSRWPRSCYCPPMTERCSPTKSSLLQVFVSISGLVLVRSPYHCEPAFAKLEGTREGKVNS